MVLLYIFGLVIIFYLLAVICDKYFVKSLDIISKKLKLSEDVAGATFMAVGSSAPEFFTALIAVFRVGSEQVGTGTIVGSAIFNILVIIGVSAIVATSYLKWKPVVRDLIFYSFSIVILLFTLSDGMISLWESIIYILMYGIYVFVLANWRKISNEYQTEDEFEMISEEVDKEEKALKKSRNVIGKLLYHLEMLVSSTFPDIQKKPHTYVMVFGISILWIGFLSWGLVELAVLIARDVGIPEVIIALTILAGGTSIPDMMSSVIVAKQGRGDMAVSNAVGSNIFNIFICLGFSWMLYILVKGEQVIVSVENLTSSVLLLFFTVVVLFLILVLQKFKLGNVIGYLLLSLYAGYVAYAVLSIYSPGLF